VAKLDIHFRLIFYNMFNYSLPAQNFPVS